MALGEKDVALALDVARSLRRPMPAVGAVHQMLTLARGRTVKACASFSS